MLRAVKMAIAKTIVRISDAKMLRHLSMVLGVMAIFFETVVYASTTTAQMPNRNVLSEGDISETIASYRTKDSSETISEFQKRMPEPIADEAFKQRIIGNLPNYVGTLRIDDVSLHNNIVDLVTPILTVYGREKVYEIIVIDHDTPMVMSDSGVVLVITTGTFVEVKSPDELLGFIAHEIGHEYFGVYSVYLKILMQKVNERDREPVLVQGLTKLLAAIELQCDAFAAITLDFAGYDPTAFVDALERFALKFKDHPMAWHPPESIRRQVVNGVITKRSPQSKNGSKLQSLLDEIKTDIVRSRKVKLLPVADKQEKVSDQNR